MSWQNEGRYMSLNLEIKWEKDVELILYANNLKLL